MAGLAGVAAADGGVATLGVEAFTGDGAGTGADGDEAMGSVSATGDPAAAGTN